MAVPPDLAAMMERTMGGGFLLGFVESTNRYYIEMDIKKRCFFCLKTVGETLYIDII